MMNKIRMWRRVVMWNSNAYTMHVAQCSGVSLLMERRMAIKVVMVII